MEQSLSLLQKEGFIKIDENINIEQKKDIKVEGNLHQLLLLYNEDDAASKGILFVYGIPKDGGSVEVQSILFKKENWTVKSATEWLKKHGFHSGKKDITSNYIRFRQKDPGLFKKFRTGEPGKGELENVQAFASCQENL